MISAAIEAGVKWLEDGKYPLDWNGPASRPFCKFLDEDLNRPIIHHFERAAHRHPNRIAVTDSDTSLSYADLWDGLSGLAETIEAETKRGDLIAIILPASSMFPLAILACLAAGRAFVVIDPKCPHYTGDWLGQVLQDAQPALIIAGEAVLKGVEPGITTARVISLPRMPQSAKKGWRPATFDLDQPACVLFTSGSTGRPKGIVNSQRNLLQRAAQSINAAHINDEDRLLTLASVCTIVGVRDIITALVAGAGVRLLDPQRVGAREILNVIRREAITILFAFPALLRSVIPHAAAQAGDVLRLVRVGGDTTFWSDIDLLRGWLSPESAIQLIYAATEAPMMQWFVDDSFRTNDARIPIGYPLAGNRLAVIDERGRNAPPGEVGELIVGSPYVALGVWIDGRCVTGNVASSDSPDSRLFRTGDLVRQRADGLLERVGRKDRQVKIRGVRVDLDGVEANIRQHPLVRDACVMARTNSADGPVTLVAYVNSHDEAPAGLIDDLKELMRSTPSPMRPARFYLAGRIPRLPSSKLDLRALAAMDHATVEKERADTARAAEVADVDCISRTASQVWQEVLQTPVRSPADDFFEAGGDSLKAITFMMELERALSLELSLTLINEAPEFGRLCEALREYRSSRYVPLVPLKPGDRLPPVFFIHGIGGSVAGLFPTARRMAYAGAVIGIQARGLIGHESPHPTVEAMAAEYLKEVRARQQHGPYYLCGYSFGGLIAFEMARQLGEAGDEVGLVGLFDTMMSPLRWPLHTWPAAVWRMGASVFERLRHYAVPAQIDGKALPTFLKSAPVRVLKVAVSALTASARYRPGFYPGKLTLFSPLVREPGIPSLQSIWSKHARALRIVETPGTHSTMLSTPNAQSAAASLTRLLPVC